MTHPLLSRFLGLVDRPGLAVTVDAPATGDGLYWLDVTIDGRPYTTASFQAAVGFGLWVGNDDAFGTRPQEIYRTAEPAARRILSAIETDRSGDGLPPLTLRSLRALAGTTQAEVSATLGLKQSSVSKLESRSDAKVETLVGYVTALGGRLDLVGRFPDFEVGLTLGQPKAAAEGLPRTAPAAEVENRSSPEPSLATPVQAGKSASPLMISSTGGLIGGDLAMTIAKRLAYLKKREAKTKAGSTGKSPQAIKKALQIRGLIDRSGTARTLKVVRRKSSAT